MALALGGCNLVASTRSAVELPGGVLATTPDGYCFDAAASRIAEGFAMMAPCASLGEPEPAPATVGIATVQVGPPGSATVTGAETALRDFLITDAGVALLSQNGNANDIQILSTQAFNGQVMVHFSDAGTPPMPGLQQGEWRAFTDVNGRLVTIAVRGLAVAPLRDGPGAGLLKLVVAGVQAVSGETPPAAVAASAVEG